MLKIIHINEPKMFYLVKPNKKKLMDGKDFQNINYNIKRLNEKMVDMGYYAEDRLELDFIDAGCLSFSIITDTICLRGSLICLLLFVLIELVSFNS